MFGLVTHVLQSLKWCDVPPCIFVHRAHLGPSRCGHGSQMILMYSQFCCTSDSFAFFYSSTSAHLRHILLYVGSFETPVPYIRVIWDHTRKLNKKSKWAWCISKSSKSICATCTSDSFDMRGMCRALSLISFRVVHLTHLWRHVRFIWDTRIRADTMIIFINLTVLL